MLQVEERKEKIAQEDYFDDNLYHGNTQVTTNANSMYVSAMTDNKLHDI